MVEYRRGAHTIYEMHLHVVWTTKYRKAVLTGEIPFRVRDLIREICGEHDIQIMKGHDIANENENRDDDFKVEG